MLLLHGAIENGRVFFSSSGKGLAPYLASKGFDVFVADLSGRGESIPQIDENFQLGQTESIVHEIPAMSDFIARETKNKPQHWIAHSWGGVLMASALARKPKLCERVASQVYFGTKRSIHVNNPQKILLIDIFWLKAAPLIAKWVGYLPAKQLKMGSDSESIKSLCQSGQWVRPGPWVDSDDGFDYAKAIRKIKLPPTLLLAGKNDACLGHPVDVKAFRNEMGEGSMFLLSRENGLSRDYGHLDMLTHPVAQKEVFPHAVEWISGHGSTPQGPRKLAGSPCPE